ncbi:MAG: regulatory protein RecX [Anaerolineae bacterium]
MARVVRIISANGRSERLQVLLDDDSLLELAGIVAISLASGQELSKHDIEALRQRDRAEDAYERVLNYLTFRPRSEVEIRRYLAEKEVDQQVGEEVITRLLRAGLLDDQAFAKYWVENREAFHPRGKWLLRAELHRAGVSTEVIDNVVNTVNDEAGALRAAQRKAHQMRAKSDQEFRRRLLSFLQRRGYSYELADRVVRYLRQQVIAEDLEGSPNERV